MYHYTPSNLTPHRSYDVVTLFIDTIKTHIPIDLTTTVYTVCFIHGLARNQSHTFVTSCRVRVHWSYLHLVVQS